MTPPEPAPILLLPLLAALLIAAVRIGGLPRACTWPERLLIALLASWTLLLVIGVLIGSWPGGLRPLPLMLGGVTLIHLLLRVLPPAAEPHWWWTGPAALAQWPRPEKLGLLMLACAWLGLSGYVLYLPPTGTDSLGYHLLGPVGWVQQGQIHAVPAVWEWANSYPHNVELPAGMLLAFVPQLRYANGWNPLGLLLLVTAFWTLGRALGAGRLEVALCALGVLLAPLVAIYASAIYCDLPLAACWLATAALLLAARRTQRWECVGWAGLALALGAGTKATGLLGIPVFSLLGWLWLKGVMPPLPLVRVWGPVAAGLLLLGAGWYLRSWVWYGNPLHPWSVAIGPVTLFAGIAGGYTSHLEGVGHLKGLIPYGHLLGLPPHWERLGTAPWQEPHLLGEWYGPQTTMLGLLALLWALVRAWRTRDVVTGSLLLAGVALALLMPGPMVARFAAHWPWWTALALALLMSQATRWLRGVAAGIWSIAFVLMLVLLPSSLTPIEPGVGLPNHLAAERGAAHWWTLTLVRPGDTVVYVQPLRSVGRALRPDLSSGLRYVPLEAFDDAVLAPWGTTWLWLADEARLTHEMSGQDREAVLSQLKAQAPGIEFRLLAAGSTYANRNYRVYALRAGL